MIGRVLLAAILAGLAAGFVMGVIQHVRLTPMIIHAESFEGAGHDHGSAAAETGHSESAANHSHGETDWMPADGAERTLYTTLTAMLTGAGFALALAGISLLSGLAITTTNALFWGLCGFLAVSFAPAVGLPPELPGMPAGDLVARQIWWLITIALTGTGLYLLAARRSTLTVAAALVCFLAPHVFGAPQPVSHESTVPAGLAAAFATSSLAANLVMWVLIGWFLSMALSRAGLEQKS